MADRSNLYGVGEPCINLQVWQKGTDLLLGLLEWVSESKGMGHSISQVKPGGDSRQSIAEI